MAQHEEGRNSGLYDKGRADARQAHASVPNAQEQIYQAKPRKLQALDQPVQHDTARMALLGDLVMGYPTLVLVEIARDRGDQVARSRNIGLGGRDRVERLAGTSH
jgi:hypothetical protein